jgi:hypothetical protein
MKLNNLNLVELDAQEIEGTNGGYTIKEYLVAYHNANVATWEMGLGLLAGVRDGLMSTFN